MCVCVETVGLSHFQKGEGEEDKGEEDKGKEGGGGGIYYYS